MQIERLNPDNSDDVAGVTYLHANYLDDSPVLLMGERFLEDFYYTSLVRDELVHVVICKHEGKIVGFISYTEDPFRFIARGMRKHFLRLCWITVRSVIARPSLLADVFSVLRVSSDRSSETPKDQEHIGEVLSLVAHPDFQKKKPEGGESRMTVRLFEEAAAHYAAAGFRKVRLNVKPENRASNIFCSVMGCTLAKITVDGVPFHQFTYEMPTDTDTHNNGEGA